MGENKNKIMRVNFNPENKLTSARAHQICEEVNVKLRKLCDRCHVRLYFLLGKVGREVLRLE
jgi:hypothetical protein